MFLWVILHNPRLPRKSVFFETLHFALSSYQSRCLKKTETILIYIFITPRPGRRRDAAVERKQFHDSEPSSGSEMKYLLGLFCLQ